MLHKALHKNLKKQTKRVHKHVQKHGHKWVSILGIVLLIILVYPYFSHAQEPGTCSNGATNPSDCDICEVGSSLDEDDICMQDAALIPITGTILYSPTNEALTTDPVVATMTGFSTTGVNVTSTGGPTHTFTENDSFTFTFENTDGATGSAVATVDWITGSQTGEPDPIYGCMDPTALNHDGNATEDTGDCIYTIAGTVTYSTTTLTTGSVLATMTGFSMTGVTVTSAGGATHTFTGNNSFTFTFGNGQGSTGSEIATVDWITGSQNTGGNEPPVIEECLVGDLTVDQPLSGAIVGGTFPILRERESTCPANTAINIQLRDHNGQRIDLGTGTVGNTGFNFASTGLATTGFYTITGLHLSGSAYTDGSTGVYTQDTIYNVYTGAYIGSYTDFATGYMLRILDKSGVVLGENDKTFTIDNQKPSITGFSTAIDNGTSTITGGTIGLAGHMTFSLTASEELSGASFTILGTLISASTGTQSGDIFTYTAPLSTVASNGALAYTAHLADIAGNITHVYGTSAIIFDSHIPAVSNFSLTGSTGAIALGWKTDVDTKFTFAYNKSGSSAKISYTSTGYGTMHNYTMSGIQNNKIYNFTLSTRNNVANTKTMSGNITVSTTGALELTIYQDNGDTFQLSEQVEVDLYKEILKREIEKFKTCKANLTIKKTTIKIKTKSVEIAVPVMKNTKAKGIVEAFLLFFINKTKETTLSQTQLNDVVARMNDFFVVLALLKDDGVTCKQTMSNYYVSQFQWAMQTTLEQ